MIVLRAHKRNGRAESESRSHPSSPISTMATIRSVHGRSQYVSESESESDGEFVPARLCPGTTSLPPLPVDGNCNVSHTDNLNVSDGAFQAAGDGDTEPPGVFSGQCSAKSFISSEPRSPSYPTLPEQIGVSLKLSENALHQLKDLPVEEIEERIHLMDLDEDDKEKLLSFFDKELFEPWEPSSLLPGLGAKQGFLHSSSGHSCPIVKMCYFLQNSAVHLQIIRQQLILNREAILKSFHDGKASADGFAAENNGRRFLELTSAITDYADKLAVNSRQMYETIEDVQFSTGFISKKSKRRLKSVLKTLGLVATGFVIGILYSRIRK